MIKNKAPGGARLSVAKPKRPTGEQFSDPLAYPQEMRVPSGTSPGLATEQEVLRREKEINRKILESYDSASFFDYLKPVVGLAVVGAIAFSQVSKTDMTSALIYTAIAVMVAGAAYTVFARDTLPPLISLILKGVFGLGLLAAGIWFVAMHSDSFSPKGDDRRSTYRQVQEQVKDSQ